MSSALIRYNVLALAVLALIPIFAFASETIGSINTANKSAKVCHDASCTTFGRVNFAPTINGSTPGAVAISITDSGITGNAWGDEIGWINMNPTGGGVSVNPSTGVLSGYAYSSVGSWINFNPTGGGVTLVDNGSGSNFFGWAWVSGANGGWLRLDCADSSTCVQTDWRSTPNRTTTTNSSGDSGGTRAVEQDSETEVSEEGTEDVSIKEDTPTFPQPPSSDSPANTNGELESSSWPVPASVSNGGEQEGFGTGESPDGTNGINGATGDNQSEDNSSNSEDYLKDSRSDIEYVMVAGAGEKPARSCLFCVVTRYDVETKEDGSIKRTGGSILKYGFVPRSYEIRIPLSRVLAPFGGSSLPDTDGTSISITGVLIYGLRRLIIALRQLL